MRERLAGVLGAGAAGAVTVGTFHSVCSNLLRRNLDRLPRKGVSQSNDYTILDAEDSEDTIRCACSNVFDVFECVR